MADKGVLAILAGKPKEGGGGAEDDLGNEAKLQAAADLRAAMQGDDDAAFASAFQRMVDVCADSGGSYEDED